MSEGRTMVADILATPEEFTFEGREFRLAPFDTIEVSAHLERWAIRRALEEVEKVKPDLTDPEHANDIDGLVLYQREQKSVRELITAGHYRYGERGFDEAISTSQGTREAIYRCLRVHHPDITRETIARMSADDAKWAEVIQRLNVLNDPKRKTPARSN